MHHDVYAIRVYSHILLHV